MKLYSEQTGKLYDTLEELEDAEKALEEKRKEAEKAKAEKEAKEKELKEQRAARAKEVEDAFKVAQQAQERANKLLNEFTKDYHSFHMTIKGGDPWATQTSLMDWMLSRF